MKVGLYLIGISLIAILLATVFSGCAQAPKKPSKEGEKVGKIVVKLPFEKFPSKYTCDGADISPRIEISSISENAKAIAIIMDDPDAPAGTFTHWIIWNIPAGQKVVIPEAFPKDAVVEKPLKAVQGVNDFKKIGYWGPCPPPGKPHRYFFKIYVLNAEVDLKPGASRKDLEKAMEGKIIQYGEAMATYAR